MKQKGFTLIELLVVVAIIGTISVIGVIVFEGYTKHAKDTAVKQNCKYVLSKINETLGFCSFNTSKSVQLMSIGGRSTIENVPCDKNLTKLGQFLIKIINHVNNDVLKNPYGNVGGMKEAAFGPIGAHQPSSGLAWKDLMLSNDYDKLSLGRCVVQFDDVGSLGTDEIGVTGFYERGTFRCGGTKNICEAKKMTQTSKTFDMR
jgi:prepilin-type N-terminal cleavage/methylation domain-containing protein